jgi:teichoic acid transport system permease protein
VTDEVRNHERVVGDVVGAAGLAPDGTEPTVLGAAATLPASRRAGARRTERRASRRERRQRSPGSARNAGPEVSLGSYSDVEYVFEPHSPSTPPLAPYLRSLWARRRFMVELARADLRGKRSSTVLGGLWGVLDPLFQAGIYYMLFTIIREGQRPTEFLHVLIGGVFLFQLALASLTEGGRSIKGGKSLMLNSSFPRALLPITTVCRGVMGFLPAVFVYGAFHVALGAPYGWGLLLLPVLFGLQLVLMVGIALLTSTIVVFFQDAGNVLQYIGRVLFFTTPVIYPLAIIPDDIRAVLSWQPFFALFASYQEVLDGGVPSAGLLVQIVLWSIGFLSVGGWVFLRHEREFAIRL